MNKIERNEGMKEGRMEEGTGGAREGGREEMHVLKE